MIEDQQRGASAIDEIEDIEEIEKGSTLTKATVLTWLQEVVRLPPRSAFALAADLRTHQISTVRGLAQVIISDRFHTEILSKEEETQVHESLKNEGYLKEGLIWGFDAGPRLRNRGTVSMFCGGYF